MSRALIEISQLIKYHGEHCALSGVNLKLEEGCTLGLIGRNGAGKTSLIRCMLGLSFADRGRALVFGEAATSVSPTIKSRLGYVPQTANFPRNYEVSEYINKISEWQPRWDADWAAEVRESLGVPWGKKIEQLSVGEQQALSIVLAIGHRPELLVLDEPVASLDPIARRTVATILAALQADTGMSILFSTHILSDLERLSTHIAVLDKGQVTFHRDVDALKQDVRRWYFTCNGPMPRAIDIPGLLHYRRENSNVIALVDVASGAGATEISQTYGCEIDENGVALEDFVVEYLQ